MVKSRRKYEDKVEEESEKEKGETQVYYKPPMNALLAIPV